MTIAKSESKQKWTGGIGLKNLNQADGVWVSFCLGVIALLLIFAHLNDGVTLQTPLSRSVVLILGFLSYLGVGLFRLSAVWQAFLKEHANTPKSHRITLGDPFAELFAYLIAALVFLAFIAFEATSSSSLLPWATDLSRPGQITLFFAAMIIAFTPLIASFAIHSKYLASARDADNRTFEHVTNQSLLISLFIIALIAILAWAASEQFFELDRAFGPVVMVIVISLFLMFILLPYIQGYFLKRAQNRTPDRQDISYSTMGLVLANPGHIASRIDAGLVLLFAPLTGATQTSQTILPHVILAFVFLPLTAMGYALAAPWGLVPIALALILAVALGRRWAWVEDDRETAMRAQRINVPSIRIGFRNDLRDEALLGYAFLFVLVPLALRQIQLWISPFDLVDGVAIGNGSITDWLQFFGIELAKAVPIVDWAEIYEINPQVPFEARNPLSQHLVFGARLMVDLVIIAALLQAWSITQKTSSQRRLYLEGQLDLLDPFTEQALFRRGIRKIADNEYQLSENLARMFRAHANNSRSLDRGWQPYNARRLTELYADASQPDMQAMVQLLVNEYGILVGPHGKQIRDLDRQWNNNDHDHLHDEVKMREARLLLENVLGAALKDNIRLTEEQSKALSSLIKTVSHHIEFFNAKLSACELLSRRSLFHCVKVLTGRLFNPENVKELSFHAEIGDIDDWHFNREPLQETRELVVMALGRIVNRHTSVPVSARKLSMSVLKWAAETETDKPKRAAQEILKTLTNDPEGPED